MVTDVLSIVFFTVKSLFSVTVKFLKGNAIKSESMSCSKVLSKPFRFMQVFSKSALK